MRVLFLLLAARSGAGVVASELLQRREWPRGVALGLSRGRGHYAVLAVSGTAPVLPQSTMCCHKAPLAISRGGRSEALGRSLCVIRVGIHQW